MITIAATPEMEWQARLNASLRNLARSIREALRTTAEIWKEGKAAGYNLSPKRHATPDTPIEVVQLIADIANDKILLDIAAKIFTRPVAVLNAMRDVPLHVQEGFLKNDIDLSTLQHANEVRALATVDPANPSPPPPPPSPKKTKRVTVEMEPDEYEDLSKAAQRKKQSVESYVLVLIRDDADKQRKRARARELQQARKEKDATKGISGVQ